MRVRIHQSKAEEFYMNLARDQKQKSVQEKLTGYQIYLSKCMKQNSNMLEWSKHADNSIKKIAMSYQLSLPC